MLECPFLTTMEENIDCFKECDLHKWQGNGGECPFIELKNSKPLSINNVFDYDFFNEDKDKYL